MNHLVRIFGVTVGTKGRLSDAATVNLYRGCVLTDMALEEGLTHLGDERGCTDHHTTDSYQLVNIWGFSKI